LKEKSFLLGQSPGVYLGQLLEENLVQRFVKAWVRFIENLSQKLKVSKETDEIFYAALICFR